MNGDLHFSKTINFHNAHCPAGLLVKNLTAIAKPGINQRSEHSCYSRGLVGLQVIRLTGDRGELTLKCPYPSKCMLIIPFFF